jgi:hypothetical protein
MAKHKDVYLEDFLQKKVPRMTYHRIAPLIRDVLRQVAEINGGRLQTSPNSPCPCGSGKKYKKCCTPTVEVGLAVQRVRCLLSTLGEDEFVEQCDILDEDAEAAYDAAVPVKISKKRVREIVKAAVPS